MSSWDLAYRLLRANYDGPPSSHCDVPPPDPSHGAPTHNHNCTVTSVVACGGGGVRVTYSPTVSSNNTPSETTTLQADILIAADGPSSTIRSLFLPDLQRIYTGYCALRGTVPESSVSSTTLSLFANSFTFFHAAGVQILAYLIPGVNGSLAEGERLVNWVWYVNFPEGEGKGEVGEVLTDKEGKRHRYTVPPGMVDTKVWERQMQRARETLPRQFVEVVCKAERPFVQAVTDVISGENEFLDGRVMLIGDALAGFRPHTVASTSQAAYDAMVYANYVEGRVTREEWKGRTMGYARFVQRRGVEMGERSQFGELELGELIKDRDVMSMPIREEDFGKRGDYKGVSI